MNRSNSLFMDSLRIFAALLVFLGHLSYSQFLGSFFFGWKLADYGYDAVIIFFVLSGFVISFVVDTKEVQGKAYAVARFSRLASVLWPALLLTIVVDLIGRSADPSAYVDAWWYADSHPVPRLLLNLFAINQIAGHDIRAFSNGPLWSVSYEAWYYVVFGVWHFLPRFGVPLAIALIVLAGPGVLALFPIWLLGYGVYRGLKNVRLPAFAALAIVVASLALYISMKLFWTPIPNPSHVFGFHLAPSIWGRADNISQGYLIGICAAGVIGGMNLLLKPISIDKIAFEKPIRLLSECTYPLYAIHYPIIFSMAIVFAHSPAIRAASLVVVPLVACYGVALLARWLRARMKTALLREAS